MALEIATIPVLTGEIAEEFETQADKAYRDRLKRQSMDPMHHSSYERGMNIVKEMLAHSNL